MHDATHGLLGEIDELPVPLLDYDLVEVVLRHVRWHEAAVARREEERIGELLLARCFLNLLEVLAQDVQDEL